MKFRKIVETCIYSSDLEAMKDFYTKNLGLEFISEEKGRHVFLKAGKSMLLIFNPENTRSIDGNNKKLPAHGAITPPACIHFALEIEDEDYEDWKDILKQNGIYVEMEASWAEKQDSRSIYFRDPAGNLVEFVTKCNWPVED
jgi:catechol 2,3-dioxygenase-like lactoylglutathione lyase family enzyme